MPVEEGSILLNEMLPVLVPTNEQVPPAIVKVQAQDAEVPPVACNCTVKLKVPSAVGVPDKAPVDAFNVSPGGREPDVILHVVPPFPVKVNV